MVGNAACVTAPKTPPHGVTDASTMKAGNYKVDEIYESVLKKPVNKFEWKEIRTTLEFKHTKTTHDIHEVEKFVKCRRETNDYAEGPEPTDATPLPASGASTNSRQIPEVVWLAKFENTYPAKMRRALVADDTERGNRVSYIIVSRQLRPITKLSGKEFLSAWWQIVVGHRTLWTEDVHHCNVSPSNLMVYLTLDGRWTGVFNDFDLSWAQDTPSGQERTGTVPFMVLDLLTQEAIEGQVKHLYQHDAESFIWVLVYVCLCYERGMFIGKRSPLNAWLRADAVECRMRKNDFLLSGRQTVEPALSHGDIDWPGWNLVHAFLDTVIAHTSPRYSAKLENHVVFETWFKDNIKAQLPSLLPTIRSPIMSDTQADVLMPWWSGRRIFYIVVFRKLDPITNLIGDDFLSAWWQIVTCHYELWENGVHHRDVSPSNLMVYKTSDGRWIGVLNDFDLSSTRDTPSSQERTGTVPFMALDHLTQEAIEGQVRHLCRHDAESFIWVLTWVCICYDDGVLIGKGTYLNDWLRVDADGCLKEKSKFVLSGRETRTIAQR
ncbi:hypothetical protein DEU56DRAFT_902391 [Suillus clintonianus]|uniref:uncharacterized protein n=1 Tax=Suillus clintonianus TaxID=1904413 RepID=UPI001B8750D8|nr:uncharacterized protein DEU56DRAFT_902391 [Suillus clintonianus]KAG2132093.1 hypothetical protein DEU56DRAFT_902391 [Suillus clintonianus]